MLKHFNQFFAHHFCLIHSYVPFLEWGLNFLSNYMHIFWVPTKYTKSLKIVICKLAEEILTLTKFFSVIFTFCCQVQQWVTIFAGSSVSSYDDYDVQMPQQVLVVLVLLVGQQVQNHLKHFTYSADKVELVIIATRNLMFCPGCMCVHYLFRNEDL